MLLGAVAPQPTDAFTTCLPAQGQRRVWGTDIGERTVDSNEAPRMRKTSSQVDYYSQDMSIRRTSSTSRLRRRGEP